MISPKYPFAPSSRFVSACTGSLHDLLMQENPSIEDILNDETSIRTFRTGNIELTEFFIKNTNNLLEIALQNENTPIALKAFNLLSTENKGLLNGLLQGNILEKIAENIVFRKTAPNEVNESVNAFYSGSPSLLVLSRFSSILTTCFAILPLKAIEKCRFLDLFLPYCSYQPVLNLFAQIIMMNDNEGKIIHYVSELALIDNLLFERINKLPFVLDEYYQELAIGYFRLIRVLSPRREISQVLKAENVLPIIMCHFSNPSVNLLNAQWSTFLVLMDDSSFPILRKLVPEAISHITSATNFFYRYNIFCVDFLDKLLNFTNDKDLLNGYIAFDICSILKNLLVNFPNHSNAHLHILKLLKTMIMKPQLTSYVVDGIMPFAVKHILTRSNIILSAFCWNLVNVFRSTPQADFAMKAIPPNAAQQISYLDYIASHEYGGNVPKIENEMSDTGNLSQLSPEQLLMIFREITMRK